MLSSLKIVTSNTIQASRLTTRPMIQNTGDNPNKNNTNNIMEIKKRVCGILYLRIMSN